MNGTDHIRCAELVRSTGMFARLRMLSRVVASLVYLMILIITCNAGATTWNVQHDPDDDEDLIGRIAALASSGDTILVGPGTYYEHIPIEGKALTFISVDGPERTILSGERPIEERQGSIFYTATGTAEDLSIVGFTLRGGQGCHVDVGDFGGGAIAWRNEEGSGALAVEGCYFIDNMTAGAGLYATAGGAIYALYIDNLIVTDSRFSGNRTEGWGGAIACLNSGTCEVSSSVFEVEMTGLEGGAAVYTEGLNSLTIQDCEFTALESGIRGLYGVECASLNTRIVGSRFVDEVSPLATKIRIRWSGGTWQQRVKVELIDNVLVRSAPGGATDEENVVILLADGDVDVIGNTFVRCNFWEYASVGTALRFDRNIVFNGLAEITHVPGGTISCNDFWPDSVVVGWEGMEMSDNIAVDPMFCDEDAGDLRLAYQSPCAAENSPGECGLIGALPAECDLSPVERMSWGAIKARFKE